MMTVSDAAVLEPVGDGHIVLESVEMQATLRGLFSEVVVSQVYRNLEAVNIEAVYTFPLPPDAVLLDLTLSLNGKLLLGLVQPKTRAEEQYEDAMEDGDSAILLEQLEAGLFTLNVGNILPGEQAVVRFRYGRLHHWQGDSLRFHLPTTIAPRYGDPATAGLAPHQIPEYALSASHGFSLAVRIEGALSRLDCDCPTHAVVVSDGDGAREISLAGGSDLMDRDFVLRWNAPADAFLEGLCVRDGDGYVALASFSPALPEEGAAVKTPRCLKLLVDCSSSMAGDAMTQAKAALRQMIALLEADDFFNLQTFGSHCRLLFSRPVMASEENIRKAMDYVREIDAEMGGTEIGAALDVAYRYGSVAGPSPDILLLTDGEIWGSEAVIAAARDAGQRIFTVGVGSAVAEGFVRELAESTSGACELVSPREDIAEPIARHFRRMTKPRFSAVEIEWPGVVARQLPERPATVYAGDTLHVFGWFDERPVGRIGLRMSGENGRVVRHELTMTAESAESAEGGDWLVDLPRVAAHASLAGMGSRMAAELAERYQLVTEQTSCVLVFEREAEQRPDGLPVLRKTPQVLAAGWGGTGSVVSMADRFFDMPVFLRRQAGDHAGTELAVEIISLSDPVEIGRLVAAVNARYPDAMTAARLDIGTLAELVALGLDETIDDALSALVRKRVTERDIVTIFLATLSASDYGKGFSRHVRRLIRKAKRPLFLSWSTVDAVEEIMASMMGVECA